MGSDGTMRRSGERGGWITHRHGGRMIDTLGRGAPGGRGRADLLRLGRACLAEDQRARVTAESTRGTGARADVGRSAVPGARTGRSDAMRGRHVAHSRHHLVSVVVGKAKLFILSSAELLRTTRVQMRWALPVTFTGVRRFGRCARRRAGTSCFGWTGDRGVPGGRGVGTRQRPSPPFNSVVCYSQVMTRSARDSRPNDRNDGSDWATTVPDWPRRGNKRPEKKRKNRETCDFSRTGVADRRHRSLRGMQLGFRTGTS